MIRSIWYPPLGNRDMADMVYKEVFGDCEKADELGWHVVITAPDDSPAAAGRLDYINASTGKISRVCCLPQYRRNRMADSVVKLLIYRASLLNMKKVIAAAEGEGASLLLTMGFTQTGEYQFEKDVCDGCCENCKDKCPC
ncbi:MAG: hypothetical protein E7430_00135 [Ruminococcaceae bacterium]|nr:hypothetical protein [Oscillospiraceae bacterium]